MRTTSEWYALQSAIEAAKAEAWGKGYEAAQFNEGLFRYEDLITPPRMNPYRKTTTKEKTDE